MDVNQARLDLVELINLKDGNPTERASNRYHRRAQTIVRACAKEGAASDLLVPLLDHAVDSIRLESACFLLDYDHDKAVQALRAILDDPKARRHYIASMMLELAGEDVSGGSGA